MINTKYLKKLSKYLFSFSQKPFDLMLLDFGFTNSGVNTIQELERLKLLKPEQSLRKLIDQIVLNPTHLINQSKHYSDYTELIEKNFINYGGNLSIYTYIPSKIERDYTCADVRNNITNKNFKNSNIIVIDT